MGRAAWARRKALLLVVAAVLAAGIGMLAYAAHLLRRTELQTIDARFSVRGKQAPPSDMLLVGIDPDTFQELTNHGMKSEFPFPRRYDAEVIDHLRLAGAKVIAMDMEFTHQTDPNDDNALIEAIGRAHGKTVLATTEIGKDGSNGILGGGNLLDELGARPAEVILPEDSDGTTRRFAFSYSGLRSFAVVAAEASTGHPVSASLFKGGTLPIDYVGPPGTVKEIPYWSVLRDKFPASAVQGKIVIVGATSPVLQDLHPTATSGSGVMPGPEIWANATATLLKDIPLRDVGGGLNLLLIVLMGALTPLSSLRVRPWRALVDALAAAILFTVLTQLLFNSGWIVSFVYPLLALALGTLGTLAILYLSEAIERQRTHDVFSRFVPADVVDQVMARTDENLRLGAVERDCTVLFSDLRGFTSFSENQPAPRVIEVVNCYLNEMTEAIMAAGGTLIAYMGDGIMAVFGAPLEQPDHADRALTAAVEMIGPRLEKFNGWLKEQGHEHEFAMGVGINSGSVMAGNIGSEQRVEYTALGDTTNTASRLEGMTKGSGHMLFIADTTRERMHDPPESLTLVGEFEVRGRVAKVPVWTVAADAKLPPDPEGGL
ncbi:MAG TPA: adenylate/guanylate cyclase domain-containing protein [Solirubrobacteraceae bacterium]|jgi:adenylate cyclase|nr:adenylate/guanylate cyclase domain-containing protein [Solirubrobacteraceae bacterium]